MIENRLFQKRSETQGPHLCGIFPVAQAFRSGRVWTGSAVPSGAALVSSPWHHANPPHSIFLSPRAKINNFRTNLLPFCGFLTEIFYLN